MTQAALEKRLAEKAKELAKTYQSLRTPKTDDIFARRHYISPDDITIDNYLRRKPLAAFNPGSLLRGDKVYIFPRLIFDYYSYTSSIGVFEIGVEELIAGEVKVPLRARIVLWPEKIWEFGHGCEDPRVMAVNEGTYMLYTGSKNYHLRGQLIRKSVLGFAELDRSLNVQRKGYFTTVNGEESLVLSNKDSAFIEINGDNTTMLTRPIVSDLPDLCWRAEADLAKLMIPEASLQPVLAPEPWEYKVGWSTNTVHLSQDEYLVGWHGVLREDFSYRNGLAIVSTEGKLQAISDYLLAPKGLSECYGDRSLALFGNGLVVYKDYLIWIGGVSDYGIGIFVTKIEEALSRLRVVR